MSYLTLLFLFGSVLASVSAEETTTTTTTTTEAPTPPPQDVVSQAIFSQLFFYLSFYYSQVFNLMRSDDDEIKTMDGEMPGVSNGTSNRIIGGKFARANQLPFMVFIGSRLYEIYIGDNILFEKKSYNKVIILSFLSFPAALASS